MEVLGTVMSVTQNLSEALRSSELKEILSITGSESVLDDLQCTVSTIMDGFQAVDRKEISDLERDLITQVKYVVFRANNLLEEFVTLAEQTLSENKCLLFCLEKMRTFLSYDLAYKISEEFTKIGKKLDAIADRMKPILVVHGIERMRMSRPRTCSFVDKEDIIGREQDLEKIVGLLLDPDVEQDVSFLSVVGIGGIGKTTLAQLVFNDSRVTNAFPLRLWGCVSDKEHLDVEEVLRKILASATNDILYKGTTMDRMHSQLQQQLEGKRFLLVLDDLWTEKHEEWCCLEKCFVVSSRGSWIMVTTRSQETARIIGDKACQMYALQDLSQVDSWHLFEGMAFVSDKSNHLDDDMVKLAREIVDRCAQFPFAINVMDSLLYGQIRVSGNQQRKLD